MKVNVIKDKCIGCGNCVALTESQIFDFIDSELTQYCSLIVEYKFSCNEFELFDYSDYLLREDAYSNKTIDNARKIENIDYLCRLKCLGLAAMAFRVWNLKK